MKRFALILIGGLWLCAAGYLVMPVPQLPSLPPGAIQSTEPADTESPYRVGFFSDLPREQVMDYYESEFRAPGQFTLNYPPEEAYSLVRDQTRSSFLEEIVHPWKQSLFINGYSPEKPQDYLYVDGQRYVNKYTLRLMPSQPGTRITVLLLTSIVTYVLFKQYRHV